MARKRYTPEQIIHMLREAEIKLAGGKKTGEVCRELEIRKTVFRADQSRVLRSRPVGVGYQ